MMITKIYCVKKINTAPFLAADLPFLCDICHIFCFVFLLFVCDFDHKEFREGFTPL